MTLAHAERALIEASRALIGHRAAAMAQFRSVQHVYFDDLDALNILHNVKYLLFMERARAELFNALGFHWKDDITINPDKFHVVAEHSIRYVAPFDGEGDVAVIVKIDHLGKSSLIVAARVESVDGGILYAEGKTRIVRLDVQSRKPCPWSARFRGAIEGWMR
jgi:acyl-CoA thioester hydrolase